MAENKLGGERNDLWAESVKRELAISRFTEDKTLRENLCLTVPRFILSEFLTSFGYTA